LDLNTHVHISSHIDNKPVGIMTNPDMISPRYKLSIASDNLFWRSVGFCR